MLTAKLELTPAEKETIKTHRLINKYSIVYEHSDSHYRELLKKEGRWGIADSLFAAAFYKKDIYMQDLLNGIRFEDSALVEIDDLDQKIRARITGLQDAVDKHENFDGKDELFDPKRP